MWVIKRFGIILYQDEFDGFQIEMMSIISACFDTSTL